MTLQEIIIQNGKKAFFFWIILEFFNTLLYSNEFPLVLVSFALRIAVKLGSPRNTYGFNEMGAFIIGLTLPLPQSKLDVLRLVRFREKTV